MSGSLFSYVDLEDRVPAAHPLRKIRQIVNDALASLDGEFGQLYSDEGRPSIAPERLLRASLIQILFSVRSERQLMEQMQYNLMIDPDRHLRLRLACAVAHKSAQALVVAALDAFLETQPAVSELARAASSDGMAK